MALHEAARQVHHSVKKDIGRAVKHVAINAGVLSGAFIGAQAMHHDPSFFLSHFTVPVFNQHVSVPVVDGLGGAVYNSGNAIGGFLNDHIPGVAFVPHLLSQTPVANVMDANLMGGIEVYTGLSVARQALRVANAGVKRNIEHTNQAHAGNGLEEAPESVRRHVQGMTALRGILAAADAVVETGEVVADGPLPYGLRDLDAAGFLALGWHPLVGEMTKPDKAVLALSILAPYVPPIAPMAVWAFLKHLVRPTSKKS